MSEEQTVIRSASELREVAARAKEAPMVALDVEGNGLFAYRARLCTVQLAWREGDLAPIAIVDALEVDCTALSDLLGASGPPKVLHDFTFDVKLLADAGITLSRLRDTSVIARMLGRKATGLASLLSSELGIVVEKDLQQHDWSARPLAQRHVEYLAGDVRHLLSLYDKLSLLAREADIEEEVEAECAFKYEMALAPPREKRPAYLRIKGIEALDQVGLAVLRRLVDERERIAQQWDVPPFKVAGNDVLVSLARARPKSLDDLARARRGISSRLMGAGTRLISAVLAGEADGSVPTEDRVAPPRPDRALLALRRAREKRLTAWRRKEAASRGVDEQVVLPGHCLQDLVALESIDLAAVSAVRGMGDKRLRRYALALAEALATPATPEPEATGAEPES